MRRASRLGAAWIGACALSAAAGVVAAETQDSAGPAGAKPAFMQGLVELKRQATARGTPEETTKTNLKVDHFPHWGPVSLLRLELPFPDAKATFEGSAFDPDFGDAKLRVGFGAVDVVGMPTTTFLELTFPTADPPSQGTGRYQFSAGAKAAMKKWSEGLWSGAASRVVSLQVQQVFAFAGDAARKDINQTKLEIELRDTWAGGHYFKGTAKPVVDWIGSNRTGAVLELEGGWVVDPRWTLALLAGGLLWGEGVPSTYSSRVELKVVCRY